MVAAKLDALLDLPCLFERWPEEGSVGGWSRHLDVVANIEASGVEQEKSSFHWRLRLLFLNLMFIMGIFFQLLETQRFSRTHQQAAGDHHICPLCE